MSDADIYAGLNPPPEGHAAGGLASDYWWNQCSAATRAKAREWVKLLLLAPDLTELEADRFVASLSPGKCEDLIRRAVNGHGTAGF